MMCGISGNPFANLSRPKRSVRKNSAVVFGGWRLARDWIHYQMTPNVGTKRSLKSLAAKYSRYGMKFSNAREHWLKHLRMFATKWERSTAKNIQQPRSFRPMQSRFHWIC